MVLKHVYAAFFHFIGDLEGINSKKSNHRQKKIKFLILKLISRSKSNTKMDDFDSCAKKFLTKVSEIFVTCRRLINIVFDR